MSLTTKSPRSRGTDAEDIACRFLREQGLRLIDRNYNCRRGEIDLVMRDAGNLVFVEVRYRRQNRYGSGLESVDRHKQQRILRCAALYLLRNPRIATLAARFDVVAVGRTAAGLQIDWIRNAFDTT